MNLKTLFPSKLDELINQNLPIYVINSSVLSGGSQGTIIVNFFDGSRKDHFKVPATFIPFAVSDMVPASVLKTSRDFRQCLTKGMLTLIDPTDAAAYMATDEAREEYEALTLSEHSARAKGVSIKNGIVPGETIKVRPTTHGAGVVPSHVDEELSFGKSAVTPKATSIAEGLKSSTYNLKEAVAEVRRNLRALSREDVYFLTSTSNVEFNSAVENLFGGRESFNQTMTNFGNQGFLVSDRGATEEEDSQEMTEEEKIADERAQIKARQSADSQIGVQAAMQNEIDKLLKSPPGMADRKRNR